MASKFAMSPGGVPVGSYFGEFIGTEPFTDNVDRFGEAIRLKWRVIGGPYDGLGGLVERIGSPRLLFGTRTPILYAEAAVMTVEQSTIDEEDKERIFWGNAAALLSL